MLQYKYTAHVWFTLVCQLIQHTKLGTHQIGVWNIRSLYLFMYLFPTIHSCFHWSAWYSCVCMRLCVSRLWFLFLHSVSLPHTLHFSQFRPRLCKLMIACGCSKLPDALDHSVKFLIFPSFPILLPTAFSCLYSYSLILAHEVNHVGCFYQLLHVCCLLFLLCSGASGYSCTQWVHLLSVVLQVL